MPATFSYNGCEVTLENGEKVRLADGTCVTVLSEGDRGLSERFPNLSAGSEPSFNGTIASRDGFPVETAPESFQGFDGNRGLEHYSAALNNQPPKQRWMPPTYGNTRTGNGYPDRDEHPFPPMTDPVGSVLGSIRDMSQRELEELLHGLSKGSVLSGEEKARLHHSLSVEMSDQTTIVISEKGNERVYGSPVRIHKDITKFVGREMKTRPWVIQNKSREEIIDSLLANKTFDDDTRHPQHFWLIIPSELKLLAYRAGLHGLTETDREKEMEIVEKVALTILCMNPIEIKFDCACQRFEYPSTGTDFSLCNVSQPVRKSAVLIASDDYDVVAD